jgi:hypothetical protein
MSARLRARGGQSVHHPGAARCTRLPDATSVSDAARFLAVGAVRARNRFAHALREANAVAEEICHS